MAHGQMLWRFGNETHGGKIFIIGIKEIYMVDENTLVAQEQIKSEERVTLGWRVATVLMVLGVPLIVFSAWTVMTAIQANKDVRIVEIQTK